MRLPIFPLSTVLFPAGVLPLRIFEARYMDMARDCLRDELSFGVCRITDPKAREVSRDARVAAKLDAEVLSVDGVSASLELTNDETGAADAVATADEQEVDSPEGEQSRQ